MGVNVTDDRGRQLAWAALPRRIVSLVPSDTYTLLRLGAFDRLVGRTRYCVAPQERVQSVEVVGGVRDPDVPRIIALEPDVVIANREDNRRRDVEALEAAGVAVLVSHPTTVRAGLRHAERLAQLVPKTAAAESLLARAHQRWQRLRGRPPRAVRTFVPVWMNPLMAVGPDSYAADVLGLLGARDVIAHEAPAGTTPGARYPRVSLDTVAARRPEIVLLPDEPYPFSDTDAETFRRLGFADHVPWSVEVQRCDGKDLFWYGLRAPEGFARLSALLDPVRAQHSTTKGR